MFFRFCKSMTTETINQAMMPGMKTQLTVLTNAETQRTQSQAEKGIHDILRVSPRPRRLCVKLPLSVWLLCIFALMPLSLRAATNDLTSALQKGLFEEEANRNLDGAISNYQSLATQFDQDRQIAATAIFRLGECYRKLSRTNEAVVQYQRILRDFPDQQTLATLSRQNLTGMRAPESKEAVSGTSEKTTVPASVGLSDLKKEYVLLKAQLEQARSETNYWFVARLFGDANLASALNSLAGFESNLLTEKHDKSCTNIATWEGYVQTEKQYVEQARKSLFDYQELRLRSLESATKEDSLQAPADTTARSGVLEAEAAALKAQITHLLSLSGPNRRTVVQQNFPNPVLTKLMQQLNEAEQKLASLTNEYALEAVPVVNATALVNTINQQIDTQVDGVVKGLQAKMEADVETAEILRAQAKSAPSVGAEFPPTNNRDVIEVPEK
jgi:tetratricopeptide (TPR) repeat protein